MRTSKIGAVLVAGVVFVFTLLPISVAHAGGGYGDIKPGVLLRHIEHLSERSNNGQVVSASADGRTVAVAGPVQNTHGDSFGHVDVWVLTSTVWTLQADLSSPVSGRLVDDFGYAVSLSADGQHLAIGNPTEPFYVGDPEAYGAVYTYTRTATGWSTPTTLGPPDNGYGDEFGSSVALSSDGGVLVVGAQYDGYWDTPTETPPYGAAWSFDRTSTGWGTGQPLALAPDQSRWTFGSRIAVSGDGRRAAVSNPDAVVGGTEFAGDVVTFDRASDGTWTENSVLSDQSPVSDGSFGSALAMSTDGSTLAVGAAYYSAAPRAFVYRRTGTSWARSASFTASNSARQSQFGQAVAVSATGDVVAVGAPNRPDGTIPNTGGVYRYRYDGTRWSYLGPTYVRGAVMNEQDGWSVALSADASRLFIGAPGYRRPGAHPSLSGGAYVVG